MQIPLTQQPQETTRLQKVWTNFVRSDYVTAITEWFLGFGGKSAQLVLIFTTLYMCAELYPGVTLPANLSLGVFLTQMFALDMGGMGLASLARRAKQDGNVEGAEQASKLSKWLIRIMIAGLVTVCLEQAILPLLPLDPKSHQVIIPAGITITKIIVELSLVIARAICSVLYGSTIHALKDHTPAHQPVQVSIPDYTKIVSEMVAVQVEKIRSEVQQSLQVFADQLRPDYNALATAVVPLLPASTSASEVVEDDQEEDNLQPLSQVDHVQALRNLATRLQPTHSGVASAIEAVLKHVAEVDPDDFVVNESVNELFDGLVEETEQETEQFVNTDQVVAVNNLVNTRPNKSPNRPVNKNTSEAAVKIKRLLRKDPTLGPTELANKAGCSKSYASQVKSQFLVVQSSS